jgi:hypothetical protein
MKLFDNIPAPEARTAGRDAKYPLATMAVGQSFYVPVDEAGEKKVTLRMKSSVARWRKTTGNTGHTFLVDAALHPETGAEVVGVWRTA